MRQVLDKHCNVCYTDFVSKMLTNTDKETDMKIETASDWAIYNGYHDIVTDTSDEFDAWQPCDAWDECPDATPLGVKAWRDEPRDQFVAIVRYVNGEQRGEQRGYGETMLLALQDL